MKSLLKRGGLGLLLCYACAWSAETPSVNAQPRWGVAGQYLTLNGTPVFLTGANYIPSTGWLTILENWKPDAIDRDMAALHKLGVASIRFPPLWPLLQPTPDGVSAEKLSRVNQLVTIAYRNGISVQVGAITGWMSGATFLPKWADGNIFTDPAIVAAEQNLAGELARALKDNPGLQGYDFGNEINALASMMRLRPTADQAKQWMDTIYQAFRKVDPHHPVADGVGGFGGVWDIWNIAETSDYMAVHSYAYFNGTLNIDPWIGQRTTYGTDYTTAYALMTGKPALVQEIGCSEDWVPPSDIGKFLRLSLVSSWAQGAAGYFWWGSHNIDRDYQPPQELMNLKYSKPSFAQGQYDNLEYSMGLLDTNNRPKPYAADFQRWTSIVGKLGIGWKSSLPVCYLLFPQRAANTNTMTQMTAFALAKQAHIDVRMWPEGKPIPADAAAIVIAGFSLSDQGKPIVQHYLEQGGVVYQSYASDFPEVLAAKDTDATLSSPLVAIQSAGLFSDVERLRAGAAPKLRDVTPAAGRQVVTLLGIPVEGSTNRTRGVFFKADVGKGTYYYLAANLEEALSREYNPWDTDDSNLIYSVLRPESPIDIDSKFVELAVKTRGRERLILLLNHSNRFQDVVLRSAKELDLRDYMTHAALGAGREVPLRLMPGEVLMAEPAPPGLPARPSAERPGGK